MRREEGSFDKISFAKHSLIIAWSSGKTPIHDFGLPLVLLICYFCGHTAEFRIFELKRRAGLTAHFRRMSSTPMQAPLVLERVIGCTSLHNAVFAVNPTTGDVASAAGCVVTLFCPARNKTVRFVRVAQPVSSLTFSADGQRLAIGTRAFAQAPQQTGRTAQAASLSLWSATHGYQLAEVPTAHSEGVAALAFSPDGRWLVSVGFAKDRALHVWAVGQSALDSGPSAAAVPSLRKVASGRISQRVIALSFAASGAYFVTAGERHLKFWPTEPLSTAAVASIAAAASAPGPGGSAAAALPVIVLSSKPGIMSEAGPEFETFIDVACAPAASGGPLHATPGGSASATAAAAAPGADAVYALTSAGMLCAFDGVERLMEHWVSLRVRSAFSLSVVSFPSFPTAPAHDGAPSAAGAAAASSARINRLYAGCSDGIVRVFDPRSLGFLGVLPAPPAVGRANATVLDSPAALPGPLAGEVYPAALAVRAGPPLVHVADASGGAPRFPVSVVYGDRSLVVWDCANLERVTKLRCLTAHAGPVWDLAFAPCTSTSISSSGSSGSGQPSLPPGTFATVSGDSTLRLWNLHPRATYGRKEAPAVAAAALAAAASAAATHSAADADMSTFTADHHDDRDAGDHHHGDRSSQQLTRAPSALSDGSQQLHQVAQPQTPPPVLHLLSPSVAAAAAAAAASASATAGMPLGASGSGTATTRSGGRSKAPLLPGARPRGVIMREQLAVLYADAEPEAEAAILAPEGDADADALASGDVVIPERGRAPVAAYRSGPGVCSLFAGAAAAVGAGGSIALALHERPGGGIFAADSWPAAAVINEPFNSETGPAVSHDRGLRCLAFSPDGAHVATGDRAGNVRVFAVGGADAAAAAAAASAGGAAPTSPSAAAAAAAAAAASAVGQCVFYEIAHDAELSTLAFAPSGGWARQAGPTRGSSGSGASRLLASGSRDTLVHIFDARCSAASGTGTGTGTGTGAHADASSAFSVAMSLPEHAEGVTAVRFSNDDARLVTTSSDGAVVFWKVAAAAAATVAAPPSASDADAAADALSAAGHASSVTVTRLKATKNPSGGVYDATVDATNKSVLAVGAGDGIAVWSLKTGRVIRTLRAAQVAEQGEGSGSDPAAQAQAQAPIAFLTRVAMDPAGLFVAAGASDCSVRLLDFFSGAALARASGHAGLVTGLAFAPDCRRLLTASLDGCIFVWRLSPLLTRAMMERLREMGRSLGIGMSMGMGVGMIGPPSVPPSLASLASPNASLASASTPAAAAAAFPATGSSGSGSGSGPHPSPLAAAGPSSSGVAGGADIALTPTTTALVQAACWGAGVAGTGATLVSSASGVAGMTRSASGGASAASASASASASAAGIGGSGGGLGGEGIIDARRVGGPMALPPRLPGPSTAAAAGSAAGGPAGAVGLGIAAPRPGSASTHGASAGEGDSIDQDKDHDASSTPRPTVAAWGAVSAAGTATTTGSGSTGQAGAAPTTAAESAGLVQSQGPGHGQGRAAGIPSVQVTLPLPSALSPPPVRVSGSPAGAGVGMGASPAGAGIGMGSDVPFEFRESILPAWVRQQQSSWETATAASADAGAHVPAPLPFSPPAPVPGGAGGAGGSRSKWAVMMSQSVANLLPATTATAAAAIAGGEIAAAPPAPPLSSAAAAAARRGRGGAGPTGADRRLAAHAEDRDDDHHDDDHDHDQDHHDGEGEGEGEVELFPPPSGGATLHFHPPPEPVAGALGLGLGAGVGIAAPQQVFTVVSPTRRAPGTEGGTAGQQGVLPALHHAGESEDTDADADFEGGTGAVAGAGAGAGSTSGFSVGTSGSPFPFASPPAAAAGSVGSAVGESPASSAGSGVHKLPSSAVAPGGSVGAAAASASASMGMRQSVSVNFMRRSAALSAGASMGGATPPAFATAAASAAMSVPVSAAPPAPAAVTTGPTGAALPTTASAVASGLPASRLGASVAAKLQRMSMSGSAAAAASGGSGIVSRQGSGVGGQTQAQAPAAGGAQVQVHSHVAAPAGPPAVGAGAGAGAVISSAAEASPPRRTSTAAAGHSPQFADLTSLGTGSGTAARAGAGAGGVAGAAGNRYLASPGGASTPQRTATAAGGYALDSSALSLGDVGVSGLLASPEATTAAAAAAAAGTPARTGTGVGVRSPPASASGSMHAPQMAASPQLGNGAARGRRGSGDDAYASASFDSEPDGDNVAGAAPRSSVDSLSETAQLQHLLESARRATSAEAVSAAALLHTRQPGTAAAEAEVALHALQAAAEQLVRLLRGTAPPAASASRAASSGAMPAEAASALRKAAADIGQCLLDAANLT